MRLGIRRLLRAKAMVESAVKDRDRVSHDVE